jgi:hypothetical protein
MNTAKTDYLNIFLIIVSCIIAFNLPFELFLFSYAILGPLHYLTEIGWLHQRNYFTVEKYGYLFLILCSGILTVIFLGNQYPQFNPFISDPGNTNWSEVLSVTPTLVLISFTAAVAMCLSIPSWQKFLIILLAAAAGVYWRKADAFILVFALLVPSIVHVWLFTGLFMLSGAVKSKQFSTYLSILVFILCSISFFFASYKLKSYPVSKFIESAMVDGNFSFINIGVKNLLYGASRTFSFNAGIGLKIQRFIAFAYTYHYLNWFSKTNVIKWHNVPKKWLITTVILWIISIALYIYDYRTGAFALYFLSMTHVLLEFPLNFRTLTGFWSKPSGRLDNSAPAKVLFKS